MPYTQLAAEAGYGYTSCTMFVTISGTTETPLYLIRNPSDSGIKILLTHLNYITDSTTSRSIYRLYDSPIITSDGAALTQSNMCPGGATGNIDTFKSPTISDNGNLLSCKLLTVNSDSSGQNRFIWLGAGKDLLVTVENSVASTKSKVQGYWVEK